MRDGRQFFLGSRTVRGAPAVVAATVASRALAAAFAGLLVAALAVQWAAAAEVPGPEALEQALNMPPRSVQVIEPHLSTPEHETKVTYRGWPADAVLDYLLGAEWRQSGHDVEFRALDGYVSRIPATRFRKYPAYLVFDSPDLHDFTIDNPRQNESGVPLGPYYLVWDNIRHPELLAAGASYWPYQVSEVLLSAAPPGSLLPGDMADRYADAAAMAQKYCLTCHVINGYGGDKWPADLAERAKHMTAGDFERWLLTPNAVKPGTTMPPLADRLPRAERQAMARELFEYLRALPAQTP